MFLDFSGGVQLLLKCFLDFPYKQRPQLPADSSMKERELIAPAAVYKYRSFYPHLSLILYSFCQIWIFSGDSPGKPCTMACCLRCIYSSLFLPFASFSKYEQLFQYPKLIISKTIFTP